MKKLAKFKPCAEIDGTISGKLLYLILQEISNKNGEVIVSQRKISEAVKISKTTVSRNLHRLKNSGYIEIAPCYNSYGGRDPNKYILK